MNFWKAYFHITLEEAFISAGLIIGFGVLYTWVAPWLKFWLGVG